MDCDRNLANCCDDSREDSDGSLMKTCSCCIDLSYRSSDGYGETLNAQEYSSSNHSDCSDDNDSRHIHASECNSRKIASYNYDRHNNPLFYSSSRF